MALAGTRLIKRIGGVPGDEVEVRIARAHHLLVSADILDRWLPRLAPWGKVLH